MKFHKAQAIILLINYFLLLLLWISPSCLSTSSTAFTASPYFESIVRLYFLRNLASPNLKNHEHISTAATRIHIHHKSFPKATSLTINHTNTSFMTASVQTLIPILQWHKESLPFITIEPLAYGILECFDPRNGNTRSWVSRWMVINHLDGSILGEWRLNRWGLGLLRLGSEWVRWTGSGNENILLILSRGEDSWVWP